MSAPLYQSRQLTINKLTLNNETECSGNDVNWKVRTVY